MQDHKTVEVGGKTYTIRQMNPTKGLKMLTRLVKLLAVPFSMMTDAKKDNLAEVLPHALRDLAERLDEEEFTKLVKELDSYAIYDGIPVVDDGGAGIFEVHFKGRIFDTIKLASEVIMFNFADFMPALLSAGRLAQDKANASKSPSTSNG